MDLGARIAAWRKNRGLTQRELAEAIGVTAAAVYQWEGTGDSHTTPSQGNLEKVVGVLGLTMERFYGAIPKVKAKAS